MKKIQLGMLSFLLLAAFGCKDAKKKAEKAEDAMEETTADKVEKIEKITVEAINFEMEPKSGSDVTGEVTFTEVDGVVKMKANFTGLSEGEHAIHLHEKADCSSDDGKSTGGHWNPTAQPHGKWGDEGGYHKGDIGNFTADADGNAQVEFSTDQWCIGCDDDTQNIIGKAVIVHQGVDDYTSQPSGAAGARISCTGIIQ